jgi:putative Holliday junction resolvase
VEKKPKILAIDVGDKRIGLAITDPLGLTAQPLFTIHRTNLRADLKSVARFLRQHQVEVVVVGYPLHADGSVSPQAEKAQVFAEAVREEHPLLTHHLLDERLTTRDAHALLGHRSGYADRRERSAVIDQVAAVLLLEAFLSRDSITLLPDPDATDQPV